MNIHHNFAGWVSLLVASTVFGYAMYRGCPLDYFEKHYLQFVTSAIILSLLESTLIFLWSLNAPLRDRAPGADGQFLVIPYYNEYMPDE